jgi:hypothetical protein
MNQIQSRRGTNSMPNSQHSAIINKIYLPIVHKQRTSVNEHPKKMMIMHKDLPFESGYK